MTSKPLPLRALITGGAGFIGSHLAEALLERGYHVTVIDNLSTGRFENIAHLTGHPRFRFAIDSIVNEIVLDRLTSESDIIFHLAAAVGVDLIVKDPVHTIETNIMGTEAVLRTALRYRCKVLIASSSEVYGKGNSVPFREDQDVVLGPTVRSRWSYAASKMVDEFLGLAYYRQKKLPVIIFRLFNTVGPRQTGQYGMVIPRFVQQALRGEPLTVYGDGSQSRCFLDVTDAVRAIIGLAEAPEAIGKVFNIGSTEEITILDLAKRVLKLVASFRAPRSSPRFPPESAPEAPQPQPTEKSADPSEPGANSNPQIVFIPYEKAYEEGFEDMKRRVPDITRIRETIGWTPTVPLNHTLERIIQHFMKGETKNG